MIHVRILSRPAFYILGKQTWIGGPDNEQFGHFWEQCKAEGLLESFNEIKAKHDQWAGPQTNGAVLGVSRVEKDPARRDFYYMIAIEAPEEEGISQLEEAGLERYQVPAATWAVFECRGEAPDSIVESEMYAFMEWLPASGYGHALAPEMEVYLNKEGENNCEFWLPIVKK